MKASRAQMKTAKAVVSVEARLAAVEERLTGIEQALQLLVGTAAADKPSGPGRDAPKARAVRKRGGA